MANNARREIELALNITTANAQALGKLRDDVKELAKEGGDAAPAFKKLADELGTLEAQAKQLQTLDVLTKDLEGASTTMTEAGASAKTLGDELKVLKGITEQAGAAQRASKADYEAARAEVKAAGAAITEYRASADASTQKTDAYAEKLKELKLAAAQAKVELAAKQKVLASANATYSEAAAAQSKLSKETREAGSAYNQAASEVKQLEDRIKTTGDRLVEAGASTSDFADAQAEVVSSVTRVKDALRTQTAEYDRLQAAQQAAAAQAQRLESLNAQIALSNQRSAQSAKERAAQEQQAARATEQAQRDAAKAAEDAANRMGNAFRTGGIRSAQELRTEIANVRESMDWLAQSGTLTGKELDAAMRQGNASIKDLERDLRGATGQLTLMDRATSALKTTFGQVAAFIGLQEAVTRTATAFYEATKGIQSMQLGLKAIYGDVDTANKQIAFLRETANSAGVSVSEISSAFTKFSASTKEANVPIQQSNELFGELVRVSGVLGLSSAKTEQALEALGQMAAKSTVSMEELRQQLGDALPGALSLVANGMNMTTGELVNMVEAGNLSVQQMFPALISSLKKMEGENNTLAGSVARVNNAITEFFQSASDSAAIQGLTSGLNALAANFNTVVDVVYGLGKAFAALKVLEYVRGLSQLRDVSRGVTTDVTAQTVATAGNTAATTTNTAAQAANTAARTANAAAAQTQVAATTATAGAFNLLANVGTGVFGMFTRLGGAIRGVMGLLGGLPGLLVMVIANYKELGTWIGETAAKMMGWGSVLAENEKKLAAFEAEEQKRAAARAERSRQADLAFRAEVTGAQKAREQLEEKVKVAGKAIEADKLRADGIERIAALYGTEAERATAATQAAQLNLAAAEREAEARRQVLEAATRELAMKDQLIASSTAVSEKVKEEASELRAKVDKMREEDAASQNTVRNLRLESAERRVASESLRDNSARVDDYRWAVEESRKMVVALQEQQRQGIDVAQLLGNAEIALAENTALYNDAVRDNIKNIDIANKVKATESEITLMGLNSKKEEVQALINIARANGNDAEVRRLSIRLKENDIAIMRATINARIIEQQAIIESSKARLAELKVREPNNIAAQRELELAIKLADARIIEAKARGVSVDALEAEKRSLENNSNVKDRNRQSSDDLRGSLGGETSDRLRNAGAIDRETDALRRRQQQQQQQQQVAPYGYTSDGFVANKDGSAAGTFTNTKPIDKAFAVKQAAETGDYSGITLEDAQAAYKQAMDAKNWMDATLQMNAGAFSLQARTDTNAMVLASKNALERLGGTPGGGSGVRETTATQGSDKFGQAGAGGGGFYKPVTININGTQQTVNVAGDQDAAALQAVLQQLTNNSGRTI